MREMKTTVSLTPELAADLRENTIALYRRLAKYGEEPWPIDHVKADRLAARIRGGTFVGAGRFTVDRTNLCVIEGRNLVEAVVRSGGTSPRTTSAHRRSSSHPNEIRCACASKSAPQVQSQYRAPTFTQLDHCNYTHHLNP